MLKFGNKEFRNLQEQVEENMKDIESLKSGQAVLDEFGIKVVGEVSDIEDLPTVAEYKESTPDWEYGDAYAVGSTSPYTLYILTRANGTHEADYWFDIGEFPAVGPQGPQGPQGPEGQQGQTGDTGPAGADAGFGTPTATATMTARGSAPTVNITSSGPNTEKVFNFDFYLPVATPRVTITSASGTLTLAEYNILFNFEDSVVVFKPSSSLAHNAYTLQRWYSSDDYIVFICLYNYTPYKTGVYRCRVDRSNRNYLIYADEAIKINKYNISTAINSTTNETAGKVLTADGNGGASWEDAGSGASTVTITVTSGTFSDSDYIKVAGDNCTIIYDDNSTKVSFRKYDETSTTITYAGPFTEGNMTYWYGVGINKAGKTWVMASAAMPISASNIKSGSYVSGLVLTTNGSGGSSWESLPTPTSLTWGNITGTLSNQTDLKNALDDKQDELTEPDTPTGTIYEYLGFTSAGVVSKNTMVPVSKISDIADVAITGSYTDLLNQPSIPDPQVQSNWTQTNSSKIDYIKNKPDLSIYAQTSNLANVATSGDYDDLLNKPNLATVATSGNYSDLLNQPIVNALQSGSPIQIGNTFSTGDKIYFDTSKVAEMKQALSNLSYQNEESATLFILDGSSLGGGYIPLFTALKMEMDEGQGNYAYAILDAIDESNLIYISDAIPEDEIEAGYHNLDANGGYTLTTGGDTITNLPIGALSADPTQSAIAMAAINGILISKTQFVEPITPYKLTNNGLVKEVNNSSYSVLDSSKVTSSVTSGSADLVTSGGVYTAIENFSSVSGVNDGTNWTSITINSNTYSIPSGDAPSNMVTTDTTQTITGNKTFFATTEFNNMVSFKTSGSSETSAIEIPINSKADLVGFAGMKNIGSTYKLLIPSTSSYTANKTIATTDDIPAVPTSASSSSSSTSTVTPTTSAFVTDITPTTETWTFTLSDGTTTTKTVVLGITPTTGNAMTGATVSTTTTTTTTLS